MRMVLGLALAIATTGMIGCGDDVTGGDGPLSFDFAMPQDLAQSMNADLAGVHVVQVGAGGALVYAPDPVTIAVGDSVMWTWVSGSHTVTSGPFTGAGAGVADGKFCSGSPSNPSASACAAETGHGAPFTYVHQFSTAGAFPYFCLVHGATTMHGTINVQ